MNFLSPQFWEHFNSLHTESDGAVSDRSGSYPGLETQALYTNPHDLVSIFSHPLIQGNLVDLGAGLGIVPLIYGALYPERKALGLEFEDSRVEVGQKLISEFSLPNVHLKKSDLLTDEIPVGDLYFLYFPTGIVLDRVLSDLYHQQKPFRLIAIESHGDLLPRLAKENWLRVSAEVELKIPRHCKFARIYEREFCERDKSLAPHDLSFGEFHLVIGEGERWLGESLGLEWSVGERYELQTPPRSIEWSEVKEVLRFYELEEKVQKAILLRRRGELTIETREGILTGFIRKIIVAPTFGLEISSGEKVEWEKILTIKEGPILCYASS